MRKLPNFVLLRAFEAAARHESFTLAANELHLSPSAISHQVRELEDYFNRPLFVRRNRMVEPTAEGRRLYQGLNRVLDAMEASCNDVTLSPSEQVLTVHCAPSFAVKWLGPRLRDFLKDHADITIRLSSGPEPVDLSRAREIDVAISYGAALDAPGVEVTPLGAERILPLCSPELLQAGRPADALIAALPLIDSQLSRVSWPDWFALNGLTLSSRPRPSFDRAALAISAAVDGMGVALESSRLAEREIARGELVEIGAGVFKPVLRETHFLSMRTNEHEIDKIAAFRGWVLRQAGLA